MLRPIISDRTGKKVAVLVNDRAAMFLKPHPGPNMDKGAVKDLRRF